MRGRGDLRTSVTAAVLVIGAISLASLGDAFAAEAPKRMNEVFGMTNLTRTIIDI